MGENTAGNIEPVTAAKLAQAYNIKIYTIGIGKEGKVPFGRDHFGRVRYVENNLDETTLREIANIGKGNFYRVTEKSALEQVFSQIDQLEKADIKESRYKDTTDFYLMYLKMGSGFLSSMANAKVHIHNWCFDRLISIIKSCNHSIFSCS